VGNLSASVKDSWPVLLPLPDSCFNRSTVFSLPTALQPLTTHHPPTLLDRHGGSFFDFSVDKEKRARRDGTEEGDELDSFDVNPQAEQPVRR
jgi:hypothetical protein